MQTSAITLNGTGSKALSLSVRYNRASFNDADYKMAFHEIFPEDEYSTDSERVLLHQRWLAQDKLNQPIGITGIYALKARPESFWVDYFGVRPSRRGSGYGRTMMEHLLQVADCQGADNLTLWTTETELRSRWLENFYKSHGFQPVDCGRLSFNGSAVSVFSKTLRGPAPLSMEGMQPTDWLH